MCVCSALLVNYKLFKKGNYFQVFQNFETHNSQVTQAGFTFETTFLPSLLLKRTLSFRQTANSFCLNLKGFALLEYSMGEICQILPSNLVHNS